MIGLLRSRRRAGVIVLALMTSLAIALCTPADARRKGRSHRHAVPTTPTAPSKDAALIIDGATGKVLYARNHLRERHPASLTKMMTLYLLFDALKKGQLSLNSTIPISYHAARQKPTNLHLHSGDEISVDLAIRALVVRSANDVAAAIAEALGGTEGHFAEMMTAKARALGMRNTFYHNASGLPDKLQITTAADQAILARHLAYDFPQYYHYFSTPSFSFHGTDYTTHNNLIGRYRGTDGIKTGYTGASGFNLVSSVVRSNTHLIGVVMGGRTARKRDREMIRLLDLAYAAVDRNPKLVAHTQVPWQVALNTVPNAGLAGFGTFNALPSGLSEGDDEDTAERRADTDDAEEEEAPTAVAANLPASEERQSTQAAPRPAQRPQTAPETAPAAPAKTVVASLRPRPSMRPVVLGDNGAATSGRRQAITLNGWTIQIGAFTDLNLARAQLAAYAERSMDILGKAQRIVIPFQSVDGQLLYRARFGPFVEREARHICQRLTERGQTCFAAFSGS